jgi:hypothetical protein
MEDEGWRMEDGGWRVEGGGWKMGRFCFVEQDRRGQERQGQESTAGVYYLNYWGQRARRHHHARLVADGNLAQLRDLDQPLSAMSIPNMALLIGRARLRWRAK